ncbi:MAG TPA: hypothetical protein G4N93_02815 [Dehalococcoidia bacterium]|nr:hypothetical protein [Dehalococcoidia bacterium]
MNKKIKETIPPPPRLLQHFVLRNDETEVPRRASFSLSLTRSGCHCEPKP